jgi:hypothetical protein
MKRTKRAASCIVVCVAMSVCNCTSNHHSDIQPYTKKDTSHIESFNQAKVWPTSLKEIVYGNYVIKTITVYDTLINCEIADTCTVINKQTISGYKEGKHVMDFNWPIEIQRIANQTKDFQLFHIHSLLPLKHNDLVVLGCYGASKTKPGYEFFGVYSINGSWISYGLYEFGYPVCEYNVSEMDSIDALSFLGNYKCIIN